MRPKGVKAGNAIPLRVKGVRSQTLSLDWGWVGDVGWDGGGRNMQTMPRKIFLSTKYNDLKKFGLLYLSLLTLYMYTIKNFDSMRPRFSTWIDEQEILWLSLVRYLDVIVQVQPPSAPFISELWLNVSEVGKSFELWAFGSAARNRRKTESDGEQFLSKYHHLGLLPPLSPSQLGNIYN